MQFLIPLLLVVLIFIIVVLYFFRLAFVRKFKVDVIYMDPNLKGELESFSEIIDKGTTFINNQPHNWYYTTSFDGLRLAGRYYDNNSTCTIFLFHGYRSSADHDFCCAVEMYYKMGFNVFLADQRANGKSEGRYITFGVLESRDVVSWVEFINAKFSPEQVIISGISMGASTVLYSLLRNLPKNVRGVIADCGYSSPVDIISKVGKDSYNINAKMFIPFLNLACKVLAGFSLYEVNSTDAVKSTNLPIFFIHGKKDTFVPCEMSEKAFESCSKNCRIFLSEQAGHGTSFLHDTDTLTNELKSFLLYCIKD